MTQLALCSDNNTNSTSQSHQTYDDESMCTFLYNPDVNRSSDPRIARSVCKLFRPDLGQTVKLPDEKSSYRHISHRVRFVTRNNTSIDQYACDQWTGMMAIAQKGLNVTHIPDNYAGYQIRSTLTESGQVNIPRYLDGRSELNRLAEYAPTVIQIEFIFQKHNDIHTDLSFADYVAKPCFLSNCITKTTCHDRQYFNKFLTTMLSSHSSDLSKTSGIEASYRKVTLQFYTSVASKLYQRIVDDYESAVRNYEDKKKVLFVPPIFSIESLDRILLQGSSTCHIKSTRTVFGSNDMRGEILKFVTCQGGIGDSVCYGSCKNYINTRKGNQLQMHLTRNGTMFMRNVDKYTNGIRHLKFDQSECWRKFLSFFAEKNSYWGKFSFVSDSMTDEPDIDGKQVANKKVSKYSLHNVDLDNKAVEFACFGTGSGNWSLDTSVSISRYDEVMDNLKRHMPAFAMHVNPQAVSLPCMFIRFDGKLFNTKPTPLAIPAMPNLKFSSV